MTLKPLKVFKKGLKLLRKRVKAKKEELQAQLAEKKKISSEDERWLDGEANLGTEEQVMDILENASDYDRGLEGLNDEQKGVVMMLCKVAGDLSKVAGNK